MTDICCIGHITLDKIITPTLTANLNGGTSFYFSYSISKMPNVSYKLVTSLGENEMQAVDNMRKAGINVEVIPSKKTVVFENKYGENMDNRKQRVLAKADPFTAQKLVDIKARYIHLGSLLADDFPLDVFPILARNGILSVDAQGFLRYVDGENVYPCDWKDKREALQYVDILKVNEHEIESLTGESDLEPAAKILSRCMRYQPIRPKNWSMPPAAATPMPQATSTCARKAHRSTRPAALLPPWPPSTSSAQEPSTAQSRRLRPCSTADCNHANNN